uniref:Uncharacterized protein n=1 Tax=Panagrolaimus sp. ES5 TaxID=591445 RepID=A0AC34FP72_9BILA
MEEEDDVIAVRRAFNETEERLRVIRMRQSMLGSRLAILVSQVDTLSAIMHGRMASNNAMSKSASQIYL